MHRETESRRRPGGDGERAARRTCQAGGGRGKGVAVPGSFDAQVREGRHAVDRASDRRPGKRPASRIRPDGQRDEVGRCRDDSPRSILDCDLHGGRYLGTRRRSARLDEDGEFRRPARSDETLLAPAARRHGQYRDARGTPAPHARLRRKHHTCLLNVPNCTRWGDPVRGAPGPMTWGWRAVFAR